MSDNRFHTVVACNAVNACVAGRIAEVRNSLGITQAVVAEYMGEHPNMTSRRESGRHDIGVTALYAMATLFQVPVDYFFEPLKPDGAQ